MFPFHIIKNLLSQLFLTQFILIPFNPLFFPYFLRVLLRLLIILIKQIHDIRHLKFRLEEINPLNNSLHTWRLHAILFHVLKNNLPYVMPKGVDLIALLLLVEGGGQVFLLFLGGGVRKNLIFEEWFFFSEVVLLVFDVVFDVWVLFLHFMD